MLDTILRVCHSVVMPPQGWEEWRRHASVLARTWLSSMVARRKVVRLEEPGDAPGDLLSRTGFGASQLRDAEKDFWMVHAALRTDGIVLSLDDTARGLYARVAERHRTVAKLIWVNPAESPDEIVRWLETGARRRVQWRLGGR